MEYKTQIKSPVPGCLHAKCDGSAVLVEAPRMSHTWGNMARASPASHSSASGLLNACGTPTVMLEQVAGGSSGATRTTWAPGQRRTICCRALSLREYFLPQPVHLNGFFPKCSPSMWRCKRYFCLKDSWQMSQVKSSTAVRGGLPTFPPLSLGPFSSGFT